MIKQNYFILFVVLTVLILNSQYSLASYYSFDDIYAYWSLNESSGTIAFDSSGNERNGTMIGAPSWINGLYNNSISFNGSQYMTIDSISMINKTFCSWTYLHDFITYPHLISIGATSYNYIRFDSSSNYLYGESGTNTDSFRLDYNFDANIWYFICVKQSPLLWTLYVNGIEEDTDDVINNSFFVTSIGGLPNRYWNGSLDEMVIYDKQLSISEIKELYSCKTPNIGVSIWNLNANCTITNENDKTDAVFSMNRGSYIVNNSNITVGKARITNSILKIKNGGTLRIS